MRGLRTDMEGRLKPLKTLACLLLLAIATSSAQVISRKTAFRDEFNGPSGAMPDSAKWTAEVGGGGWGNQELQYYRNSPENAYMDGNGNLVIKAIKEPAQSTLSCWYGPCRYTSARLITKAKFDRRYGRVEARIKVPRGKGVWPAFWMLGSNIDTVSWPQCGEIDIMEHIGREPNTVYGTLHGPGYSGANGISTAFNLPGGAAVADTSHVYTIEWSASEIRWYVDGAQFKIVKPKNLPTGSAWVFDRPFFIILNFAVGGSWPGSPDDTTAFPQTMEIDYVRVFSR